MWQYVHGQKNCRYTIVLRQADSFGSLTKCVGPKLVIDKYKKNLI